VKVEIRGIEKIMIIHFMF